MEEPNTTTNIQERIIDLSLPDQTTTLNQPDLSIASMVYQDRDGHLSFRKCFFRPQGGVGPHQHPHQVICCEGNLISVYDVSTDQGIQLNSQYPLPELTTSRIYGGQLKRDFHYNSKTNKVTITTHGEDDYFKSKSFKFISELNLREILKNLCSKI